jgi:predicted P-loop ATPase
VTLNHSVTNPIQAEIIEPWLIFYHRGMAVARVDLDDEGTCLEPVNDAGWPINVRAATLHPFEPGVIVGNGAPDNPDYDDRFAPDCLPGLPDIIARREYLYLSSLWEQYGRLPDGEPQWTGGAPFPVHWRELKCDDMVRRHKLYGAVNLMNGNTIAISYAAASIIDKFNENYSRTERWPAEECPQLPSETAQTWEIVFRQMNSALRRLVAMTKRPKAFRLSRFAARVIGALRLIHEQTYLDVVAIVPDPEGMIEDAAHEFDQAIQKHGQSKRNWVQGPGGRPDTASLDNVRTFLKLKSVSLRFDEFSNAIEVHRLPRFDEWNFNNGWHRLDEDEMTSLWLDAREIGFNIPFAKEFFRDSVKKIAMHDRYDALADAVNDLRWDKTPRLDTWLSNALGVPADAYHAAVGRNLIGGLVKRAREPGCKHDEVVLLISPEGYAKSSFCEALAFTERWFTDSLPLGGRPQDIIPQMRGKQVIELAELHGMSTAETNNVKALLSRKNDQATLKYEREARDQLRRHIFIGTTNDDTPLKSLTGNRRWLPIRVEQAIDLEWVRENIGQLYAEAAVLHDRDETFGIPPELWAIAGHHQEAARSRTAAEEILEDVFGLEAPAFVTSGDVATFTKERDLSLVEVQAAFKRLGFASVPQKVDGETKRVWRRGASDLAVHFKGGRWNGFPALVGPPKMPALPPLPPLR